MTFEEEFENIKYWGKEKIARYISENKLDKQNVKDILLKIFENADFKFNSDEEMLKEIIKELGL